MRKQRYMALAACVAFALCAAPAIAWTQSGDDVELAAVDAPLRIAVIDATSKTKYSKKITSGVRSWLKKVDGVEYVKNGEISKALDGQGIEGKALRSSKTLKKNTDEIAEALGEAGLDGVVLVEGRSKGKYLDVIVIGARGDVIETGSKKLKKKKRVKESEIKSALAEPLRVLNATVREQRSEALAEEEERAIAASRAATEAAEAEANDTDDPYGLGLKDEASLSPKGGALTPTFSIEVGGLLAQRSVSLTNDVVILDHVNPFAGATARLDVGTGAGPGRVGLTVIGAWGMGSALADDADLGEYTLDATYASVQAELGYEFAVAETVAIGLSVRGERTSATLTENPRYTGHRYTLGGAKLLARAALGPAQVELSGGPLAVIDAETSDGAYGAAALAPLGGFFAGGRVLFPVNPMFALVATYELRSLGAEYDAGGGSSSELMHVGGIGLRTTLAQ